MVVPGGGTVVYEQGTPVRAPMWMYMRGSSESIVAASKPCIRRCPNSPDTHTSRTPPPSAACSASPPSSALGSYLYRVTSLMRRFPAPSCVPHHRPTCYHPFIPTCMCRGTSPIRRSPPLGPYCRPMPRVLGGVDGFL
jgi:hypothetical protein